MLMLFADASEDLRTKAKRALKNVLQKCVHLSALEPLLAIAPPEILKHVVGQFSKVKSTQYYLRHKKTDNLCSYIHNFLTNLARKFLLVRF